MTNIYQYIIIIVVLAYPAYRGTKWLLNKGLIVKNDEPQLFKEAGTITHLTYIEDRIDEIILGSKEKFLSEKGSFSPSETGYYMKWYEDPDLFKKEDSGRKFDFLVRLFKM